VWDGHMPFVRDIKNGSSNSQWWQCHWWWPYSGGAILMVFGCPAFLVPCWVLMLSFRLFIYSVNSPTPFQWIIVFLFKLSRLGLYPVDQESWLVQRNWYREMVACNRTLEKWMRVGTWGWLAGYLGWEQ
jgi:hypothetical protein